ncbi:MAG: phosphoribosylanthranilate isomerase [Candidatus Lindowbacteria bacterium]|nr:phosphoribosylanthranilate isomerase [Candidatus Lindowbacteria bacterium]
MTRVKICGITNIEDALWAVEQGADAIGFVFAPSPRRISRDRAKEIREQLPPFVSVVGVFVNPDPSNAREVFEHVGLDFVQFYGSDERHFLRESALKRRNLIHAISVASTAELSLIERSSAATILMDTKVEGKAGGTGKTFDWSIAEKAKAYGKPIILSGGLNLNNVETAIRIASPEAVDVSSSVESTPGKKDPAKVREFIRRAKGYVA